MPLHEIHGMLHEIHETLHEIHGTFHEIHGTLHEIHGMLYKSMERFMRSMERYRNIDFCKEEKVEDFVFKLEKVMEMKVAYFYTPSPKNSSV